MSIKFDDLPKSVQSAVAGQLIAQGVDAPVPVPPSPQQPQQWIEIKPGLWVREGATVAYSQPQFTKWQWVKRQLGRIGWWMIGFLCGQLIGR